MIQAEKGIPYPGTRSQGRVPAYPWRTMKVGESFPIKLALSSARSTAFHATRRVNHGTEFRAAVLKGKVRVWRVK